MKTRACLIYFVHDCTCTTALLNSYLTTSSTARCCSLFVRMLDVCLLVNGYVLRVRILQRKFYHSIGLPFWVFLVSSLLSCLFLSFFLIFTYVVYSTFLEGRRGLFLARFLPLPNIFPITSPASGANAAAIGKIHLFEFFCFLILIFYF